MIRHFINFFVLALLSYGLWFVLYGRPDIPLWAWLSIWIGVAAGTAALYSAAQFVARRWRMRQ